MNQPYVKQYNRKGVLVNPIKGIYKSLDANRRKRKEMYKIMSETGKKSGRIQIIPIPFSHELTPKGRIKRRGLDTPVYKNRRRYKCINHPIR